MKTKIKNRRQSVKWEMADSVIDPTDVDSVLFPLKLSAGPGGGTIKVLLSFRNRKELANAKNVMLLLEALMKAGFPLDIYTPKTYLSAQAGKC